MQSRGQENRPGVSKNDWLYHLYDITKKIRDTADRINGLERPVGNALESNISINSIGNEIENVKWQIQEVLDSTSYKHAAQMESYTENKDSDLGRENRPGVS